MIENEFLNQPVEILDVSVRTVNALKSAEIFCIKDLIELRKIDALKIPNLGKKSIDDIRMRLFDMGVSLREDKVTKQEKNINNALRDHFAGLAISTCFEPTDAPADFRLIAHRCYEIADAMLVARKSIHPYGDS